MPLPFYRNIIMTSGINTIERGFAMQRLQSIQAKYLRGLAHPLKPIVFIGQKGLTLEVINSTEAALNKHELIKLKFNDFKEKPRKQEICRIIEEKTGCRLVGTIGNIAILYREHRDPEKRKIQLP